MARTFWPNGDALGQCVKVGADTAPCRTVVGVVQDTERSPLGNVRALRFYMPYAQVPSSLPYRFLFARTAGSPESMSAAVRSAVASVSADAFIEAWPLAQVLDSYNKPWKLGRAVFVVFAVLATIIATIGLYGVIAFGVMQRRRELGIRLALGASRQTVVRMVVLGAGVRMAIGAAVGMGAALVLGRRLGSLLFQTSPTDAFVFAAALTVVLLSTLVACALPAWRAVRVDPTVSLRVE
jgi:ABC-type antimicrobial peptide transport system permease subunit